MFVIVQGLSFWFFVSGKKAISQSTFDKDTYPCHSMVAELKQDNG